MSIQETDITLRPFSDDDFSLFGHWLDQEYIYRWFCPDGEAEKQAWLTEVKGRNDEFFHLFPCIVMYQEKPIGFGMYADMYFEAAYFGETYGEDAVRNYIHEQKYAYEISYCIGDPFYMGKGIGNLIVKKLIEMVYAAGGKAIFADPDEANIASVKTLLHNGFIKYKDGDYRKME